MLQFVAGVVFASLIYLVCWLLRRRRRRKRYLENATIVVGYEACPVKLKFPEYREDIRNPFVDDEGKLLTGITQPKKEDD